MCASGWIAFPGIEQDAADECYAGTDKPLEKRTFYTKVEGQNCGVGFYKD